MKVLINRQFITLLSSVSVLASITPSYASIDTFWPLKENPDTTFQKTISPQSSDTNFVINGRPAGYVMPSIGEPHVNFKLLSDDILKALDGAKDVVLTNGQTEIVETEDLKYLPGVKKALAYLSNPALKLTVGPDGAQVTYIPPDQSFGNKDITLYDALSCAYIRQDKYSDAEQAMLKSLERKKAVFGWSSDQVADQLLDIACMFEDQKDEVKAGKYFAEALAATKSVHGEKDQATASVLLQMAYVSGEENRTKALEIMNQLGLPLESRAVREGAMGRFSWINISQETSTVISEAIEMISRRKADIQNMKDVLYNMVHEAEIRAAKAREAERKRFVLSENEKFLKHPNLDRAKFSLYPAVLPAFITFRNGGSKATIEPYYDRFDAKQVPIINGTVTLENFAEDSDDSDSKPDWHVSIESEYQGTVRVDEWRLTSSDEELGIFFLTSVKVEAPYPKGLKGKVRMPKEPKSLSGIDSVQIRR